MQFANQPQPAASSSPETSPAKPAPKQAPKPSRMILANVTRGKIKRPPRVFIYGAAKIGKSAFAAGAPGPVFFGKDDGTDELDVGRIPRPRSFKDMLDGLTLVRNEAKSEGWKTLVIDPINWFEILIQRAVSIEVGAPFDAFEHSTPAMAKWRVFQEAIERLWEMGMGIVFIAHEGIKRVETPDVPAYERFEPAMSPRPAGLFLQWVDAILFARQETTVLTGKRGKGRTNGYRYVETEMQPSFVAGNRYGLPARMDLSWEAFADARDEGSAQRNLDEIREIARELEGLGDTGLIAQVEGYLESKASRIEVLNKLRARRERTLAELDAADAKAAEKPEARADEPAPAEDAPNDDTANTDSEGDDES